MRCFRRDSSLLRSHIPTHQYLWALPSLGDDSWCFALARRIRTVQCYCRSSGIWSNCRLIRPKPYLSRSFHRRIPKHHGRGQQERGCFHDRASLQIPGTGLHLRRWSHDQRRTCCAYGRQLRFPRQGVDHHGRIRRRQHVPSNQHRQWSRHQLRHQPNDRPWSRKNRPHRLLSQHHHRR